MKDGMLLPTRRNAGLNDELFHNNAQECSNILNTSPKFENQKLVPPLVTNRI